MKIIYQILNKILSFEDKPQKIGLCQLKETPAPKVQKPSINSKNIKLSDLMHGIG